MKNIKEIQEEILAKSSLNKEQKKDVIKHRFKKIPKKLSMIYDKYELGEKKVLEVGCAFGQILIQSGKGSFGVDINNNAIEFIKSMGIDGLSVDVDKNDLKEIPDNYFDLIYIADTLEHLESPHGLLVKLRDKLKSDGQIIIYIHTLPKYKILQYFTKHKVKGLWSATHYYQYNFDTFSYLLECSGFKVENYFIAGFFNYKISKFLTIFFKNLSPIMFFAGRKDEKLIKRSLAGIRKNQLIIE